MERHLGGGGAQERARDELDRLRQGSTDVGEYILKFTDLASQAGLDETEKNRRFINNANESLRLHLIGHSATTFSTLAERARMIAPITDRQYQRTKGRQLGGKSHGRGERVNSAQEKGRKFGGECYNCGKKGHMKKDCRSPPRQTGRKALEEGRAPLQITQGEQGDDRNGVVCLGVFLVEGNAFSSKVGVAELQLGGLCATRNSGLPKALLVP